MKKFICGLLQLLAFACIGASALILLSEPDLVGKTFYINDPQWPENMLKIYFYPLSAFALLTLSKLMAPSQSSNSW
ncbi:hypothetical protein VCRA2113O213_240053 [Vibrio crassostreae]|nr:hypothetical protein BCT34_03030 [Vibrio sp. 10N.261.45.E2]PMN47381.1 hypothetical protein BCT32_10355 [Vibrio sp. 10N.261.45.E11]CAK1933252.1 hypothetical protein VCRA2113O213_240053 [Vibrio crassostreae]